MKTPYRAKQKNFKRSRKISRSKKNDEEVFLQLIYSGMSDELNKEILNFHNLREIIDEDEELFPDDRIDFT